MSRVIKFRAWDVSENEIDCCGNERIFGYHEYMGHPIMQFTGLKDCNGVEIYEGDILRGSYGIPGRLIIAPVEFCNAAFMVMSAGHNPSRCPLHEFLEHVPDAEIAGNIHQAPELLS